MEIKSLWQILRCHKEQEKLLYPLSKGKGGGRRGSPRRRRGIVTVGTAASPRPLPTLTTRNNCPVRNSNIRTSRTRLTNIRVSSYLELSEGAASGLDTISSKGNRSPGYAANLVRKSSFLVSTSLVSVDGLIIVSGTWSGVRESHVIYSPKIFS